jgi:hypothetical protein
MKLVIVSKGGHGSGDWWHSGRPGKVGGSSGGKGTSVPIPRHGLHEHRFGEPGNGNSLESVTEERWNNIRTDFESGVQSGLSKDLKLSVGRPTREGSWTTQTFTVETADGRGFAQSVLWYNRVLGQVKVQQQDVSLPSESRGKGIGDSMIRALASGYKAIEVGKIPIHVNTNPSFWSHMNKKYPGLYEEKHMILVMKGSKSSGHHGHRGRHGKHGGSEPGGGFQSSFLPEKPKIPKKVEKPESPGFEDDEIPKGWRKFSHESIMKASVGGTKKVYIVKQSDGYSVQRRYLGNPLAREATKPSPKYKTLTGALKRADEWLEREKI